MARNYTKQVVKIIWAEAAGRCAFPRCETRCVIEADGNDPECTIGHMAHIVAHSDEGPRGNRNIPEGDRGRPDNLILLCPNHHQLVDAKPYQYDVKTLQGWKENHKNWINSSLARVMPDVTFSELEIVTKAILAGRSDPTCDFTVLDPSEKMERNGLTERVHFSLSMGLGKAKEVASFVQHVQARDSAFPERLKAGFVEEYRLLSAAGLSPDEVFESLRVFASNGSVDFKEQAAGLAVLAYLFEKCEVFES